MKSIKNNFRRDINGLRALAVISVVLFHFSPDLLPGGFAGVDVFFVISGFLMTSIIIKKLEIRTFSFNGFILARIERIVPALLFLCFVLLIFGWFFLSPEDYRALAKHSGGSITFLSNVIYLMESGYFDSTSHEKWLLHTWSLSVEWQFYIIYPIILVIVSRFFSISSVKTALVVFFILSFTLNLYFSVEFKDSAYFLLITRAWEMLAGGIAYFASWKMSSRYKRSIGKLGLMLILLSCFFINQNDPWPGYLAVFPVFGTCLVIFANYQNGVFAKNLLLQSIGKWSYSIYLWHWPIVVFGYYFGLKNWILLGIPISIFIGWISYRYIEAIGFQRFNVKSSLFHSYAVWMSVTLTGLSSIIFLNGGVEERMPNYVNQTLNSAVRSPYRDSCHLSKYEDAEKACTYFGENIRWAVFGDSHAVELGYALAERLSPLNQGVAHYSFSSCPPSYRKSEEFSVCSKWYTAAIDYISSSQEIKNVMFIHHYSDSFWGIRSFSYPNLKKQDVNLRIEEMLSSIDNTIEVLAARKDNVFVFYPVPELQKNVKNLVVNEYFRSGDVANVEGTPLDFYYERNSLIIKHFTNSNYPSNVHFIKPSDYFCNDKTCFAVINQKALYFDDDHPSLSGAKLMIQDFEIN